MARVSAQTLLAGAASAIGGAATAGLRRLWRDRRGTSMVEFGFVGPPFIFLILAIVDMGLMVCTQMLLDGAARDAARLVRTGQVQTSGTPLSTFQNQVCADMAPLLSTATCNSQVLMQVQSFPNIGSVAFTPCTQNQGQLGSGTCCTFSAGNAGQVVGVQLSYARPFLIPWVGACFSGGTCWFGMGTPGGSNAGTDSTTLMSTVIFQNEPFS